MKKIDEVKQNILDSIRSGEVSMRPRWTMVAKAVAIICIAIAIMAVTLLLFGYVSFALRVSGRLALLGFGWNGILYFLLYFPWLWFAFDAGLVVVLSRLIRLFDFGWKIPYVHLVGLLLLGTLALGVVVDIATPFNERIHARRAELPAPVYTMYDHAEDMPDHRMGRGVVLYKSDDCMHIEYVDARSENVVSGIAGDTMVRDMICVLRIGDRIILMGEKGEGDMVIKGIQRDRGKRIYYRYIEMKTRDQSATMTY